MQHDQVRILALEREVVLGQDSTFAKEREAREERLRADGLQTRFEEIRSGKSKSKSGPSLGPSLSLSLSLSLNFKRFKGLSISLYW